MSDTVTISRGRVLRFRPVSALTAFLEGLFSQPLYVAMQRLIKQEPLFPDEAQQLTPQERKAQASMFRQFACALVEAPTLVMGDAGDGEVSVEKLTIKDLMLIWNAGQDFLKMRLPPQVLSSVDRFAEQSQQRMIGLYEAATAFGVRPSSWLVDIKESSIAERIAALDFDMAVLLIGRDFERRQNERHRQQQNAMGRPRRH